MERGNFVGAIPIILGVTGHRDIPNEDYSFHTARISDLLSEFESKYTNSPLVLLSCLADGADRIAAKCALDRGWILGTILPMEVETYKESFESPDSIREFEFLYERSVYKHTITEKNAPESFLDAGRLLCRRSHALIALWNGKNGKVGGTSNIIRIFSEGDPEYYASPVVPDTGLVWHIYTRRLSDNEAKSIDLNKIETICIEPRPAGIKLSHTAPPPLPKRQAILENGATVRSEVERWNDIFQRIDRFNKEVKSASIPSDTDGLMANLKKSYASQEGLAVRHEFDPCISDNPALKAANQLFISADTISLHAQTERRKRFFVVIVTGAMAIVLQQMYAGIWNSPYVMLLSLIFGLSSFGVYKSIAKGKLEERYIEYRGLAEACRVQFFWILAGIKNEVINHFLFSQRNEWEWLRQAAGTIYLHQNPNSNAEHGIKLARYAWIGDQHDYFIGGTGRAYWHDHRHLFWDGIIKKLITIGFLFYFIIPIVHSLALVTNDIMNQLSLACSLSFAAAALCKLWSGTMSHKEHASRFIQSGTTMRIAEERLNHLTDTVKCQNLLYEVGRETLEENSEWILLHCDRPVTPPF